VSPKNVVVAGRVVASVEDEDEGVAAGAGVGVWAKATVERRVHAAARVVDRKFVIRLYLPGY